MLVDHQFRRLAAHRPGIVPDKEDHGLGVIVLLPGKDPVDPVLRRDHQADGVYRLLPGNTLQGDIGLDDPAQCRLLVEDLAEPPVPVREVIGISGK